MFKSALVMTTAAAIAFAGLAQPAAAAPQNKPGIVKQAPVDEVSAARKRRHGYRGGGFPLATFGMIAGTIGAIAAAERQRGGYPAYYEDEAPYGAYGAPVYGAPVYGAPTYEAPYGYEESAPAYGYGYGYAPQRAYAPRVYQGQRAYGGQRAFQGRVGGQAAGPQRQFVQRNVARPQGPRAAGPGVARGGQARH